MPSFGISFQNLISKTTFGSTSTDEVVGEYETVVVFSPVLLLVLSIVLLFPPDLVTLDFDLSLSAIISKYW